MSKPLTLQLNSSKVSQLVLGTKPNMSIDVPHNSNVRAKAFVDTTENWSRKTSYIPSKGEIIVYSDHSVIDGVNYPAIKIGDGLAYVVDLPFVGEEITNQIIDVLNAHISNTHIHVTDAEKAYWNNKLDCEFYNETLILAPAIMENGLLGN